MGQYPGIILWMHPANEKQRYIVTSPLIGWPHTQNDPCVCTTISMENTYDFINLHICRLAQDCSNSSTLVMESSQSLAYFIYHVYFVYSKYLLNIRKHIRTVLLQNIIDSEYSKLFIIWSIPPIPILLFLIIQNNHGCRIFSFSSL